MRGLLLSALALAAAQGGAVLGGELWLRAQESRLAAAPIYAVADVEEAPPLRISRIARLPKGSAVLLKAGRGEAWRVLRECRGGPCRDLRRIRRLRGPVEGWALLGLGAEGALPLPRLARARRSLTLTATAYDPGPVDNSRGWVGTTATGLRAQFGVAAVDPGVIPQGSLLYVEGYGPALAADRGGAIKGLRIDLCFNRTRQALDWGRRRVRVWILERVAKADAPALESLLQAAAAPAS